MTTAAGVTPDRFRHVMRHVPTGVAVVSAASPEGPLGLAVGSFVSVSLEPPLVGFFVARTSSTWPRIEPLGRFCVNVLGEEGEDVSRAFAVSGGNKFGGVRWEPSPLGSPVLDGALAWFDCTTHSVTDAGDHVFVLADVHELSVRPAGRPLIFCHGTYQRLS
ncbi:flavin reductase (DIM6/NTAB) family NADH-FMN oxidoreductase RutF [Amycolatopsis bartoniae]|uniref:Monooxygenase n=1 Tax=Amycolatopsis bartoniae TaxID=941986 RepID=A0A8H9IWD3_9PSEU|nr:flavin reductase family protein [Amycolatopsis bartoniae]MBB2937889.1 flavin reductase (DIM6/NTAB) family NADH-FMN oxidoreductase RutF [Amycolatopsis bartoniae]TVT08612.1 flavin reductase family protein [Amycolatopsis bartoniae]GHF41485.1 monooxygenase [Amycolatopsis bartoniae]